VGGDAAARSRPRIDRAPWVIALIFVASRAVFYAAGVRFDASPLPWFWQYLDVPLLRADLGRSLWFLHIQPPLFNAYLGAVLKLAAGHPVFAFQASYLAVGLLSQLALYGLLRRLGVGQAVALAATLVYGLGPTALLYENLLFYTHLETAGLVVTAWSLHRVCETRRPRDAALYFGALTALAMTRNLFHLAWLVACAVLALVASRPLRRGVVGWGAAALLVVGGLYAKNAWLFGSPAGTSWFGMYLAHAILTEWTQGELQALVKRGVVSPLVLTPPFSPLEEYPESLRSARGPDLPALRAAHKERGEANYNHEAYLAISRLYARDAATLIRHDPTRYARMVSAAWGKYLLVPSNYVFVAPNLSAIRDWDRLYGALLYGVPRAWVGARLHADDPAEAADARDMGWLWLGLALASWGYAALVVARGIRSRWRGTTAPASTPSEAQLAALAFCLFNVAFMSLAANALEVGENNRFRAPIEPLVVALVAFAASDGHRRWRDRRVDA
jgi:hypothetical protein